VLDTHVGDALKEPEEVSNQSSGSKLQEGQDDKKQLIVRKPNPFYPTCVRNSISRTKKLKVVIFKSKKFRKNQASSALVAYINPLKVF
jgi:uncharacterized protein YcnI